MSKSTISTFQLFAMIPDAETARLYLESRLWPEGATCPSCLSRERITARKGGFYRCNRCALDFTVRTATIFERSHVPLHKWVYAMYLVVTARKGISSMQMAKEIGVTQKTAWFRLQRLREACEGRGGKDNRLSGLIEVDECFVGGLEKNKHAHKKLKAGRGSVGKTAILGRAQAVDHRHVASGQPEASCSVRQRGHVPPERWPGRESHAARLDSFIAAVDGKRLTYARLTA